MPQASQIEYNLREIAELMVRNRGITEGHWMVLLRFKWAAANVGIGPEEMSPSAIVGVESIGIQRTDSQNPLSVDASKLSKEQLATAGRKKKK